MSLLRIENLEKRFAVRRGWFERSQEVHAVSGVSLEIYAGETVGLVGESGCGKSTLGKLSLRLLEPTRGKIVFEGRDLTSFTKRELFEFRRHAQMIFQDPIGSLNGRKTVRQILCEGPRIHGLEGEKTDEQLARELLERVGLDPGFSGRYPHEFSGGQRQRIGIARALSLKPRFIVADEPVSALDVSVQAQVINLMVDLQKGMGLTFLFVSHDLRMVDYLSSRVVVMYLGRIMEVLPAQGLRTAAVHPYTQALLSAVPSIDPTARKKRVILSGDVPSPLAPPPGCVFHTRCPIAEDRCKTDVPALRSLSDRHETACHLV